MELAQEEGEHLVFVDGVLMPLPPTFAPAQDTAATAMVTGLTVEEAVEEAASEGLFNEIIEEDPDDVPEMDLDG